jgi:NAD(P)-dependent dehydrogenase (short-subunit alcohol dehydrogenase family)
VLDAKFYLQTLVSHMGGTEKVRSASRQPMNRVGEPEGVAAAIAFLASDDASFMTGLSIPITGGRGIH